MRSAKLYNVIFPIWFILFLPPVIFITLTGNFIIDSLVVMACYYVFKLSKIQESMKVFYKKSILRVWLYGFLADIIGASLLLLMSIAGDSLGIPYQVTSAINYDPFKNPAAVTIIVLAMLMAALFIFIFNYRFTFREVIAEKGLRLKVSLTIALITLPWTFLLPTKWFHRGF